MIKITKKYKIENISSAFNINVIVPNCAILLSKKFDDATKILTIEIEYCDSDCLNTYNKISIFVYDSNDCVFSQDFEIGNTCNSFDFTERINVLTGDDKLCTVRFRAPVNQTDVSYKWKFDTTIFTEIENESNDLYVKYTKQALKLNNFNTTIYVTVTNSSNCVITDQVEYLLCNPQIQDIETVVPCVNNNGGFQEYVSEWLDIPQVSCKGAILPLTNIKELGKPQFINGFQYILDINAAKDKVKLSGKGLFETETVISLLFSLEACEADIPLIINASFVPCGSTGSILPIVHNFDCDKCKDIKGSAKPSSSCPAPVINLNNYIFTDVPPVWDTFTFIPTIPIQSLESAYSLLTPYAQVVYSLNNRTVTYLSSGGLNTVDLVFFSVDLEDGTTLKGELRFNAPDCQDDGVVAPDVNVCITPNDLEKAVKLGLKDQTVQITQFPASVNLRVVGGYVYLKTDSYVGTDVIKYRLSYGNNLQSNEATINIESKIPKIVKQSVCTNELGKAVVDLGSYNLDIELQEVQWIFAGYSTDADTEQYASASFSVNTPLVKVYNVLDIVSLNNIALITLDLPGIYKFRTKPNLCISDVEVYVEVIEPEQINLSTYKEICKSTGIVNLFSLIPDTVKTTGTWTSIGSNLATITDNKINTIGLLEGTYLFRYSLENQGLYNAVACTSNLLLSLKIDDLNTEILPACITLCSVGPDPLINPNCQNIEVTVNIDNPLSCTLNFYNDFNLISGSIIRIGEIPLTPILLKINGITKSYKVGDTLPVNFANWEYYKAPLGKYRFTIIYGGACEQVTNFEVTLVSNNCKLDNTNIKICNNSPAIDLYEELSKQGCDVNSIIQKSGSDNTSFNSGVFTPLLPGAWVFKYGSYVLSDFSACEVCSSTADLNLIVAPLPGPGQAAPKTSCKTERTISLYPTLFNPSQSILGTFKYSGFRPVYVPLNQHCSNYLTVAGEQLFNTPLITDAGTVQPNTVIASGVITLLETTEVGFYYFTNTVIDMDGCECTTQTVLQVVGALNAGTPIAPVSICTDSSTVYNLRNLITGEDSGGAWLVHDFTPLNPTDTYDIALSENGIGFWQNADQATFNVTNQPAGSYTFRYIHTTPPSVFPLIANDGMCEDMFNDVIIQIGEIQSPGNASSAADC